MSARAYQVVHRTAYTYDADVSASHGRAHLLPRDEPGQQVHSRRVEISPEPDETHEHVDYFGNRSTYFRLERPHRELTVVSTHHVEVDRTPLPWTDLDQARVPTGERTRDVLARELLLASPMVPLLAVASTYAREVLRPDRPLGEALADLLDHVRDDFTYTTGSTTISTPVETVFAEREGVCQDFAHVVLACLRVSGLAAGYVSGYMETLPPPGKPRLVGADASHAWVSVLVPGVGWIDLDPTNHQRADSRYIVVARGRDYSDVPPLKGVIYTKSTRSTLQVSVDVQPVTPVPL